MRPIPISARQLQALVRLSEASAKVRLSEIVSKQDAQIAIELMKYYLMQVGYDYESKTFDIDRIGSKMSHSKRSKVFKVREAIVELENRVGKRIPLEELKKELEGEITETELEDALLELKKSSTIFEPQRGFIERV